jgi:hypothetical protein
VEPRDIATSKKFIESWAAQMLAECVEPLDPRKARLRGRSREAPAMKKRIDGRPETRTAVPIDQDRPV